MTEYSLQLNQDAEEDRRTMRKLATVIGGFVLATVALALSVGFTMG